MANLNPNEYPVDASLAVYCDAPSHATKPVGAFCVDLVQPADAEQHGVHVFGVLRRLVDGEGIYAWRPDVRFLHKSGSTGEFRLDWLQVVKPGESFGDWEPVQIPGVDRRTAVAASELYTVCPDVWGDEPVAQWRRRYNFRCPRCGLGFRRGGVEMETLFDEFVRSQIHSISLMGLQTVCNGRTQARQSKSR